MAAIQVGKPRLSRPAGSVPGPSAASLTSCPETPMTSLEVQVALEVQNAFLQTWLADRADDHLRIRAALT